MKILAGMIESKSSLLRKVLTIAESDAKKYPSYDEYKGVIVNWSSLLRFPRTLRAKHGSDYVLQLEVGAHMDDLRHEFFICVGHVYCLLKKQLNIVTADLYFTLDNGGSPDVFKGTKLGTFTYSSYREAVESFISLMGGGTNFKSRTRYIYPGHSNNVEKHEKNALKDADKLDAGVPLDY